MSRARGHTLLRCHFKTGRRVYRKPFLAVKCIASNYDIMIFATDENMYNVLKYVAIIAFISDDNDTDSEGKISFRSAMNIDYIFREPLLTSCRLLRATSTAKNTMRIGDSFKNLLPENRLPPLLFPLPTIRPLPPAYHARHQSPQLRYA